jgi:hypothetical protein
MLMMGVAVGLILLEMKLLSFVIVTDEYTPAMVPAGGGRTTAVAAGPQQAGFPIIPGGPRPEKRSDPGGSMG